jgi:hypothetical protein
VHTKPKKKSSRGRGELIKSKQNRQPRAEQGIKKVSSNECAQTILLYNLGLERPQNGKATNAFRLDKEVEKEKRAAEAIGEQKKTPASQ